MRSLVGTWYWIAFGVTVAGGVIPAVHFLWTFRPRNRWKPLEFDLSGFVAAILALYVLGAWRAAYDGIYGGIRPTVASGLLNLAFAVAIDVLLWHRAIFWARLRRDIRRQNTPPEVDLREQPPA